MNKNIGLMDKIARYVLAIVFIALGLIYSYFWFIPAIILIITATIGWCGLYTLFGINTCPITKPLKVVKKQIKKKR